MHMNSLVFGLTSIDVGNTVNAVKTHVVFPMETDALDNRNQRTSDRYNTTLHPLN